MTRPSSSGSTRRIWKAACRRERARAAAARATGLECAVITRDDARVVRARPALLIALAWLAAAAVAPAAPAPPALAQTLVADTSDRWVSFDLTPGNQIRFDLMLDGSRASAILDTGVSHSVLARDSATTRRARVTPAGNATAIGGIVAFGWTPVSTLAFGGLRQVGGRLAVAPLPALATGSDRAVDVLVGRDLVGDYALDIDYAARRFRLLPSGRIPFTGTRAPLSIAPERQVYVGEIRIGDVRLRPMVIDTGDGATVTLAHGAWASTRARATTTTALSYGLVGPVVNEVAILPEIRTGDLVARNVEVRIEPADGFSDQLAVAGRIGTGFLQNYRVLLDPRARHMILRPGATADRPPIVSTSGLLLGLAGDRLRVLHVMRGGPGDAAGWQEGDAVCTVDGAAIGADYADTATARWSADTPGRTVLLGMCDGTTRRLTLRRFY